MFGVAGVVSVVDVVGIVGVVSVAGVVITSRRLDFRGIATFNVAIVQRRDLRRFLKGEAPSLLF